MLCFEYKINSCFLVKIPINYANKIDNLFKLLFSEKLCYIEKARFLPGNVWSKNLSHARKNYATADGGNA